MSSKKKNPQCAQAQNEHPAHHSTIVKLPIIEVEAFKEHKDPGTVTEEGKRDMHDSVFAAALDTSMAGDMIEQLETLLRGISKTINAFDPSNRGTFLPRIYESALDTFMKDKNERELASISLCICLGQLYDKKGYWEIECAETEDARHNAIAEQFHTVFQLWEDENYDFNSFWMSNPKALKRWIKKGLELCDSFLDYIEEDDEPILFEEDDSED